MEERSVPDLGELVDADNGVISREIFVDEAIFRAELSQVFARAWLFVGHETQVPGPGDFFVSRMGTESVLLTRDSEGELHVLLNSCRHRGMKVCRYDEGNTLSFTCPYHGWSYSVDGSLVSTAGELLGVPHFRAGYGGKLDRSAWGLVPVAQMVNHHGLVFATWDPQAPPFEDYVGDFHYWLDNLAASVSGEPGAVRVVRGVQKWRIRANWKFVSENFLGDNYHGPPSHASVDAVGIGPGGTSAATRHGAVGAQKRSISSTSFVRLGHGATSSIGYAWGYPTFEEPELTEYFARAWERRAARFEAEGRPIGALGPATLFPSMSFHAGAFPRALLVAHPLSPWETEVWRWYLVDADAPPDIADWLRRYYLRYSGPGGLVEQDDMENWDYATEASRGTIARRYAYNYQLGLGMAKPSTLRGAVESEYFMTEENARNFYRRWRELMSGASWHDLMAGT
jgi:phenylpropionate dioxygenase-like ring-hydroxylating dioxygenase large terminal subunit